MYDDAIHHYPWVLRKVKCNVQQVKSTFWSGYEKSRLDPCNDTVVHIVSGLSLHLSMTIRQSCITRCLPASYRRRHQKCWKRRNAVGSDSSSFAVSALWHRLKQRHWQQTLWAQQMTLTRPLRAKQTRDQESRDTSDIDSNTYMPRELVDYTTPGIYSTLLHYCGASWCNGYLECQSGEPTFEFCAAVLKREQVWSRGHVDICVK